MTEEDAKTKWCFAAVASHTNPRMGFDYGSENPKIFPCLGSACMAWRSVPVRDTRPRSLYRIGTNEKVSAGITGGHNPNAEWRLDNPDEPPPPPSGYCGLAGQP